MLVNPAQAQTTLRGCANPAGQLRLIGATDSCRPQETLVTWNTEGLAGPPGSDAPGVTGGTDRSPLNSSPAFLFAAPTPLTTDNIATGFSAYMVWANVSLQFNTGNGPNGLAPSPQGAGCSIVYTVEGRTGTFFVDSRSVTFPISLFREVDRIVQLNVGLTGMVGQDLSPPLLPSESVNITLQCNSPGYVTPPSGPVPVPVKATNFSLSGIGVNKVFGQ